MKITPADETAMTIERQGSGWFITIEQGNGDVIRTLKLTEKEYGVLGFMATQKWPQTVTFRDPGR